METPRLDAHPGSLSYSKSTGGRSRSPLVDEYTEPRWNHKSVGDTGRRDHGADDRSRFPIGEAAGVDAEVGIGGILAGLGSGDYPMQNEEQEEEKRIQDVSRFYLPLDPDQPWVVQALTTAVWF